MNFFLKSVPSVSGYAMGSQTLVQLSRYADDKEKREKSAAREWNGSEPFEIIER